MILRLAILINDHTIPACDRQTDRRTQDYNMYTVIAYRRAAKPNRLFVCLYHMKHNNGVVLTCARLLG